jgi:hypothetical protein
MVMPSLKGLSADELLEVRGAVETLIDFRDYLPPGGRLLMEMGKIRDDIRDLLQMPPLERVHREPGRKPLTGLEDAELGRLVDAALILIAEFPGYMDRDTLRHLIDVLGSIALEKQARAFAEEFVAP